MIKLRLKNNSKKRRLEKANSLTELLKLTEGLGFKVEYNQWDIKTKNWIRFRHRFASDQPAHALVIYKSYPKEVILEKCAAMLLEIGKYLKIMEISNVISINLNQNEYIAG